jgi:hypothetical protein
VHSWSSFEDEANLSDEATGMNISAYKMRLREEVIHALDDCL